EIVAALYTLYKFNSDVANRNFEIESDVRISPNESRVSANRKRTRANERELIISELKSLIQEELKIEFENFQEYFIE
ncbi:MAG: hypothetical protein WCF23_03975, partial [Candidatus Nitrosopolaris sp.]